MPIRKGPDYHKIGKRCPIPFQFNSLPFQDHRDNTAYMAFYSYRNFPFPRLFVFAIYFTHPDVSPDNVDPEGLLQAPKYLTSFRLELFLLPGATDEDCMAYYRGEKAARGDLDEQIAALMESDPYQNFDESYGRLPGWVSTYTRGSSIYHSVLFMCTKGNWNDQQMMHMVKFDPISEEEYEDHRDPGEPTRTPEKRVSELLINEEIPLYRVGVERLRGRYLGFHIITTLRSSQAHGTRLVRGGG